MKKNKIYKWVFAVSAWAFVLACGMGALSESIIPHINVWAAGFMLMLFIGVGILFDIIGIAVTCAAAPPFHSMNAKNVKGAGGALFLISNAEKVSNFCNDVVGDILGIISGSAMVIIVSKLTAALDLNFFYTTIVVSGLVASVTIGGKAAGKNIAINKAHSIVYLCGLLLNYLGFAKNVKNKKRSKTSKK